MSATPSGRLWGNSGGGPVDAYDFHGVAEDRHLLRIHASVGAMPGIVQQVRGTAGYVSASSNDADGFRTLKGRAAYPDPATIHLLDLLKEILTLPSAVNVDFTLALDWTKVPDSGEPDPSKWPPTDVYKQVSAVKYGREGVSERSQASGKLVERLSYIIDQHPLLRTVDGVASVPGHDPKVVSLGESLASALGRKTSIPLVKCSGPNMFRVAAKNLTRSDRAARLFGQFNCEADLREMRILVVDDVYETGSTINEAARALRAAGAETVAGLSAARTLSFL